MYSVEWNKKTYKGHVFKLKLYKTLQGAFKAYQKKEHALLRNVDTNDIIYEK